MFNIFKSKSNFSEQVKIPVLPTRELLYLPPVYFKKLKWVMVGDRIGIITDLSDSNYVTVDFTDNNGLTVGSAKVPINQVRIANWEDIPELRRPPDPYYAYLLGYERRGN